MSEPLWGANLLSLDATAPVGWVQQFHLNRALAQQQLGQMYANGQRCARVVLCVAHGADDPVILNITGSCFSSQQQQNLTDLLRMLADQGFLEVELALMPQAANSAWQWDPNFNPDTLLFCQELWNLIVGDLVPVAAKAPIPVRIDLNNEGVIGTDSAPFRRYREWLWAAYTVYIGLPLAYTIGFSIQPSVAAFEQMPGIYGSIWPQVHSLHVARGVQAEGWCSAAESYIATVQALAAYGQTGRIEVGETAPNEPEIRRELTLAALKSGRAIHKIMQWPLDWRLPVPVLPDGSRPNQNCLPLEVPAAIPL